jgi:hypothetical protein
MDDEWTDLVGILCARAGAEMEDASVFALTLGSRNGTDRSAVLTSLVRSADRISALLIAARALDWE